ncbi:MAG: hypothetical protein PVJ02_17220 [Gemmatimonadota bacterium]|jgi:hypothetical protein
MIGFAGGAYGAWDMFGNTPLFLAGGALLGAIGSEIGIRAVSPEAGYGDALTAQAYGIAAGAALAVMVTQLASADDDKPGLWIGFSIGQGTVAALVSRVRP